MERRKRRRQLRRLLVTLVVAGKRHTGYTTNLSLDGAFVSTRHLLPAGTPVQLEVTLQDTSFVVNGMVVRARQVPVALRPVAAAGVAIRFTGDTEPLRAVLRSEEP